MTFEFRVPSAALAVAVLFATGSAFAPDDSAELAKQLSNPISSLISLPLQYNYDDGLGCVHGRHLSVPEVTLRPKAMVQLHVPRPRLGRILRPSHRLPAIG